MTSTKTSLACAAVLATLAACAQQPTVLSRSATPEDLIVAVVDPGQQQLWGQALTSDALPPLDAVKIPLEPVEAVRVAQVPETQRARAPSLPEAAATAIVFITLPRTDGLVKRAQVLEVGKEKLSLLVEGGERLELAYRSPSRAAIARLVPQSTATVESVAFASAGPAHRYGVAIGDATQTPALVVLQNSGDQPIAQEFRLGQITIRQVLDEERRRIMRNEAAIPPSGAPVPVQITVEGRSAIFPPGTIAKASETGIGYDVVVYESSIHPLEAAQSDTPPFALHVAIFAAGAQ